MQPRKKKGTYTTDPYVKKKEKDSVKYYINMSIGKRKINFEEKVNIVLIALMLRYKQK